MNHKKHKPKNERNLALHSRKTGALILIGLIIILIGGGSFFILAWNETLKIQENEERFRLLPCDDMKNELQSLDIVETWQKLALIDKECS